MKIELYAVKDVLVGLSQPFCAQNEAVARRMFIGSAQAQTPNVVNTFPENKELWKIGDYDDQTGAVTSDLKFIDRAAPYCTAPVNPFQAATVASDGSEPNPQEDKK